MVDSDGGTLVGMLVVVLLLCSAYVLVSRRKEIPFVGYTF